MKTEPQITTLIEVVDASHVGEARREIVRLAQHYPFSETELGQIAIVVVELANNLAKHAQSGQLLVRVLTLDGTFGFEIISVDRGPGIQNIAEAMRDGYSTARSPGTGMGAISRLSQCFEIYTTIGKGTIVLSQIWTKAFQEKQKTLKLDYGVVCLPNKGESVCGDNWAVFSGEGLNLCTVFDGLGHGHLASEASAEAMKVFAESTAFELKEIILRSHDALKKTRGAAGAVLRVDRNLSQVKFAGIGNISAGLYGPITAKRMASHNGTLGLAVSRVHEFDYQWDADAILVMHSDGLGSHWKLESYPGIFGKNPSILAALLFRDHKRGTDDVTILVGKKR